MKNTPLKQKIKEQQDILSNLLNQVNSENYDIFFDEFKKGEVVVNHSLNNQLSYFSYIPTEKFVELYVENYYDETDENNCYDDKEDFLRNNYNRIGMYDKTDGITYIIDHSQDGYTLTIQKKYNLIPKETFIEIFKKHNLKLNLVTYYNNIYKKLRELTEDMEQTSEMYRSINS
jgi:hypothetical protein